MTRAAPGEPELRVDEGHARFTDAGPLVLSLVTVAVVSAGPTEELVGGGSVGAAREGRGSSPRQMVGGPTPPATV